MKKFFRNLAGYAENEVPHSASNPRRVDVHVSNIKLAYAKLANVPDKEKVATNIARLAHTSFPVVAISAVVDKLLAKHVAELGNTLQQHGIACKFQDPTTSKLENKGALPRAPVFEAAAATAATATAAATAAEAAAASEEDGGGAAAASAAAADDDVIMQEEAEE
jgi:hypothetical protein